MTRSSADDDPRCPECDGPIGLQATFCMHCSADLTEEREVADADGDGSWDQSGPSAARVHTADSESSSLECARGLLDPDGFVDDTLTAVVGIVGGVVGTVVLLAVPVIALSPVVSVEGGRGGLFVVLLFFVAVPAAVAAAIGRVASRYVPDDVAGSEG